MKLAHLGVSAISLLAVAAIAAPAQAVTFANYSAVGNGSGGTDPNIRFTGASAGGALTASAPVDFSFLTLGSAYSDLAATFTFSGISSLAPATYGSPYTFQTALTGSFSFIYSGATTAAVTHGENLLSGTFSGASISGPSGGSTASVQDAILSGGSVAFTSSVLPAFPLTGDKAFALELTSVTPDLIINRSGALTDFTGVSTGSFASDISSPGGAGGVPEPATWAMMLIGFAGVGFARRSAMTAQRKALA